LDLTGLLDRADDDYQRYSTGMQRKLLLCRGLLRDTQIILFDEPTTGLDPYSASEFRNLIKDTLVREEGKTVLLSTHNLSEAQEICDRIAIMDRGKITACDTPDRIRFDMMDENEFIVSLHETIFSGIHEVMLDNLQEITGIKGVTPNIQHETGRFLGLSLRIEKNMDLSEVIEFLIRNKLSINAINTKEPTLEDAFIAITGNRGALSERRV
jgi:ABC-2 type transport system ATP-binding protein